jgi:lysophospholipase L1-like esterase
VHQTPAFILWLKRGGEFVVFSLVAILLVEGIFRLCGIGQQEYLQPDPVLGCRHIPNQLVTWRLEGYSHDRLSSAGLRDVEHSIAKPVSMTRVALLGDSSTEGLQVPLSQTYARVLEKQLNGGGARQPAQLQDAPRSNYEVINFACSGYSTGQEYLQFKKDVEQYKPDVTVVLYNCGDALENIRDPNKVDVESRPYFYLGNDGQLKEDDLLLKKISLQSSGAGGNSVAEFLQRNSRICGVLKQADLMLSINEKLYRKLRSAFCRMYAATTGAAGASLCYKAQYAKPDSTKVSEQLLLALSSECKRVNSKFILALFPNTNNNTQYAGEQKKLHAFAAQNKIAMVDLTNAFLFAPAGSSELFLQYHFSARGHKLVAEQLGRLVQSNRIKVTTGRSMSEH